jgi:arylsulfatase A-like enzyme/Flp pilus assembly protein TadD
MTVGGVALLLTVFLLATGACSRQGGTGGGEVFAEAPVVLISIDTLRSDRLPVYGYKKVETPAIDALAQDSILYERAYAHYPLTFPSHASILSGLVPPHHGVRDNVGYPYDGKKHPTLARHFKDAGYDTAGFVSAYVLRGSTGISEGFDTYEDKLTPQEGQSLDAVQRPGSETAQLAIEWLRGRTNDRPFFLFFHLYEPHAPYQPPEPFASRFADPYDGEVATADSDVGQLLDELKSRGIYDKALIVLLSDHGEALGDHGGQTHGVFLYREALQVPLLVKLPGSRHHGTRVAAPAGLVDVVPTLLAATGVEVPRGLDGTSLLDLLSPQTPPRQVYAETFYPRLHYGWSDLASMIDGRFHYIEGPDPELYDVVADPKELKNLFGNERRALGTLRQALARYDRKLPPPGAVDPETASKLASLGYAVGSAGVTEGVLPDPKSQMPAVQLMETSFAQIDQGQYDKAVEGFRKLVAMNPKMMDIWSYLGLTLQRLGRHEEAVQAYDKAMQLAGGGSSTQFALPLASSFSALGRYDEARKYAEVARKADPRGTYHVLMQIAVAQQDLDGASAILDEAGAKGLADETLHRGHAMVLIKHGRPGDALQELESYAQSTDPATRNAIGLALSITGRPEEARRMLESVLAAHPDNTRAYELLGVVAMQENQPAAAEAAVRRALSMDQRLPGAWTTLGVALYQQRRPAEAVEAWKRSVALDPAQFEALYNLGLVARELGRRDEARAALRQFAATAPPERYGSEIQKAQTLARELGG